MRAISQRLRYPTDHSAYVLCEDSIFNEALDVGKDYMLFDISITAVFQSDMCVEARHGCSDRMTRAGPEHFKDGRMVHE